jgi:hypothetical protein
MTTRARGLISIVVLAFIGPLAAAQCPPSAPAGLDATDGDFCDRIALSWSSVGGASWYEVWRSQGTDFGQAGLIGTSPTTSYNDSPVILGTHYYYWVTAWRVPCTPGSSRSAPSARNQGTAGGPGGPAPANFTATARCGAGLATYLIDRRRVGDEEYEHVSGSNDTSFTDLAPILGAPSEYVVRASGICGSISLAALAGPVVAHAQPPSPPLQFTASDGTVCEHVRLEWSPAPRADTYMVWRAPPASAFVPAATGLTGTTYDDLTAASGVMYTYYVRAVNACGESSSGNDPGHFVDCPADFNCSGEATVQDVFDFLAAYFSGDLAADFNGQGGTTVQDIFDFLSAYFGGCD